MPWNTTEIDRFAATTGHAADLIAGFYAVSNRPPVRGLRDLLAKGHVVMLTIEPWELQFEATPLASAAAGKLDTNLTLWASDLSGLAVDYPGRVWVRYAHEMNGNWYPWGVNNNSPKDYRDAFRRASQIFNTHAPDVSFVWSPNVRDPYGAPLSEFWPGDNYVDVIGVDGYNGGTDLLHFGGWKSFSAIFDDTLQEIASFTAKPVIIAETASAAAGGNKAQWIDDAAQYMSDSAQLQGLVWFDIDKETDWRYSSNAASAAAFTRWAQGLHQQ